MNIESKIEAILFYKGEPTSKKRIAEILSINKDTLEEGLANLKEIFKNRGIVLMEQGDELTLGTAPELSSLIENLQKEELNRELSRASLETLSVILYKNGASRSEIDYIRGVNSSFILRALSVRGLVDKVPDPRDSRKILYKPTLELLSFMGVKSLEELPEFEEVKKNLDSSAQSLEDFSKEETEKENGDV